MKQNQFDFNDYIKEMLDHGFVVNITSIQLTPVDFVGEDYGVEGQEPERAKPIINTANTR